MDAAGHRWGAAKAGGGGLTGVFRGFMKRVRVERNRP
jgi:hypothetical protein